MSETEAPSGERKNETTPLSFRPLATEGQAARLVDKLEFLREIEKLKTVLRRNTILGGLRRENDAEHSWHISLMAVLFWEDAAESDVDLLRVLKMLLIHDLVEIDAGDTYAFDVVGHADKAEREARAADRIFGLLPLKIGSELQSLWKEFEAETSTDARFALALDRLQPALQNYLHRGTIWHENGITPQQVLGRLDSLRDAIPELAQIAERVVEDAEKQGFFP